jgi:cellulose synthase/poly-beta-1,6-N-acetylglucosamine synthase-like glycosyltransferase
MRIISPEDLDIPYFSVDDGSKDMTWSIGKIFSSNENGREVKVFHKKNGGKASTLKYGISRSSGDIILMTDGDSGIHPGAVTSIVDEFRNNPDAGIVGGYVFIRNTHSGYLTKLQQLEYIITQHLIRINQSTDGSVLIAPGPIFGMRGDLARTMSPLDRTIVEDCDLTMSVLPTRYTTRATTNAVAYTNAPTSWSSWFRQRKRWIYGQFQAWRENKWHLKRNPWGLYTFFTWVWTTISASLLIITSAATIALLMGGGDYYQFIEFLSIRSLMVFILYSLSRVLILLQYHESRMIIHYLPLKMVYDLVNGFLTAYLFIRFITGRGVKMEWGNRSGVYH